MTTKYLRIGGFLFQITYETDPTYVTFAFHKLNAFETIPTAQQPDIRINLCPQQQHSDEILKKALDGKEVFQRKSGFYKETVRETAQGTFLWQETDYDQEITVAYEISSDWSDISLLHKKETLPDGYELEYLIRILPCVFCKRQALLVHGVLLEYQGQGILISAPSGVGKSTHAHFWRDELQALILNGDRVLCRKEHGIWMGYGMPWCGTSGEYLNRSVPLIGMTALVRGEEDHAERLSAFQGFQYLFQNIQAPQWNRPLFDAAMDLFDSMLDQIPAYKLSCTPTPHAAKVLQQALLPGKQEES